VNENAVAAIEAATVALRRGRRSPLLIALDGRSGVGKSTIAAALAERLGATIVESDDFFAGGSDAEWLARAPSERAEWCIDWRRVRRDALEPLLAGHEARWHPFNFETGEGLSKQSVTRPPSAVIVLDGIYSARPELADLVDLAVLVEMRDDRARRARLLAREGAVFMSAWHPIWDAAEDHYFTVTRPPASFDLIVTSEERPVDAPP
jgi:uridine kinase